jgi:hypothetical protein
MGFKKAERFGGGFLDLKELAANGPVLVVFGVREFHPVEKASGFDGYTFPVTADALICDGPRKGEVHKGEKFIGAITSVLRGVANARKDKGQEPQEPVNEVWDGNPANTDPLIVARVEVINPGKNNAAAVGNVPSDADMEAVAKFYGDGSIWNAAQANGAAPAMAGAGAGGGQRPW